MAMNINFATDSHFNITAILIAVTDTELWLSAGEATNGGESDSIIINWSHGTRDKSLAALKTGMNIEIGSKINVRGERNYWPAARNRIDWTVNGKVN